MASRRVEAEGLSLFMLFFVLTGPQTSEEFSYLYVPPLPEGVGIADGASSPQAQA